MSNFTETVEARLEAKVEPIYKGGLVLPHARAHSKKELLILLLSFDVTLQHFWTDQAFIWNRRIPRDRVEKTEVMDTFRWRIKNLRIFSRFDTDKLHVFHYYL